MKQKLKNIYDRIFWKVVKEDIDLIKQPVLKIQTEEIESKRLEILERNISLDTIKPIINYTPFKCKEVLWDGDKEKYRIFPNNYPKNLKIKPLIGLGNDYSFLESEREYTNNIHVSIVILTYNGSLPLSKILLGILNQNYPLNLIEVIVTDDGGRDDNLSIIKEFSKKLDIKYSWYSDVGFTPAAARNNGIGMAGNDFIILLDVNMYPGQDLVQEYVNYNKVLDQAVLIGARKYVDLNDIEYKDLLNNLNLEEGEPGVITNNGVTDKIEGKKPVDWRLEVFEKTDFLRNEKISFRVFSSGNVAFSKNKFNLVGRFYEGFNNRKYEDLELGFRFFNSGLYMIPVSNAWVYQQEIENYINETDHSNCKEDFSDMCPYYRHLSSNPQKAKFIIPKVSIYIPAYNAEKTIIDAVESVLNQTFTDIEVCICDDGSTDRTLYLLEKYYTNDNRVRWISQKNTGIGAASNSAVKLCRGIYIGQLDSDDYLAEDVVEKCFVYLDQDPKLGLVYTANENEYNNGDIIQGYNYPVFTREKMLTVSLVHHFRLFKKLYWRRTEGFNERIKNAVDYDMFLKLSEVCEVKHLNIIGYRRRLHGGNTSILDSKDQNKNTAKVVNLHLERIESDFRCELVDENLTTLVYLKNGIKYGVHVEVKEDKDSISFIVHPETNDKKIAFYLYNGDEHIDTQWYSKNMTYVVDKKMRGKGDYGVRYFLVNENDEDPGNTNNKQVGISKNIVVPHR